MIPPDPFRNGIPEQPREQATGRRLTTLIIWLTGVMTGAAITLLFVHDKIH